MAVAKSKISRSRRGQRRSHDALGCAQLSECADTGRTHRRHHMTEEGVYRGKVLVSDGNSSDGKSS
jgi:large subunit ribosomal protein L32